jgi:hypothetical protein
MFDARLEINIYRLLRALGRRASAWIGATIAPEIQTVDFSAETEIETAPRAAFEETVCEKTDFLDVRRGNFSELDSTDSELSATAFEYVLPRSLSGNTAAAIPFIKTQDAILVGLEFRDLPAPQNFTGNSRLLCAPAWRLPREITHKSDIVTFLASRFELDFHADVRQLWELGGSYFTSAGVTPEIVYPFAAELDATTAHRSDLTFFNLAALLSRTNQLHDAHLLIVLNRLGHALGQ